MDPTDVAFIKGMVVFVVVVAGLAVLGFRFRFRIGDRRRFEAELDRLAEENAQLRRDLEGRLAELEERVDFTERRLVQGPSFRPLPNPSVKTPV